MGRPKDAAAQGAEPSAARGDPRTYDYSGPSRTCDIVMKGGITSGVVYPHAICELARTYRFVDVGGTSAGAIAAAAAAAAEHGREQDGFRKLAALPTWIGEGDNLLRLFQPQPETRSYFRLFAAGAGHTGAFRWLRVGLAAVGGFPLTALAGVAPGMALAVLAAWAGSGALAVSAGVAGVVLALLGLAMALGLRLAIGLPRAVARNDLGLCTGMPSGGSRPALTPWLADLLDDLAGKDDGAPLTFGDLEGEGRPARGDDDERHAPAARSGCPGRTISCCSTRASSVACSPSGSSRGWRRTPRRSPRDAEASAAGARWERSRRSGRCPIRTTCQWSSPRE